nr:hypothetical protein [Tanacetum cinerariifolium]
MNHNFYNSNSSSFDQTQPPQFPIIHQPPQEASIEMLHDQENAMNFVQTFLRKFNRYSFFETPKVLLLAWDRVFKINDAPENKQYKPDDTQELFRELFNDVQNIHEELAEYINISGWNRPAFYDDDDDDVDYTIAITPVLSTKKPDNSLSMGDEHLDTIPATESDEVLKSSVKNLIPIPSESEGIPEHMCDVPFHDNSLPDAPENKQYKPDDTQELFRELFNDDFSESNDEFSSTNNDSFSIDNIDYVEASPPDSKLVSSEVMEIVIPEVGGIDDDILLTIKDDILREKLLNVNLLIAKIEALNDNPTLSSDCKTKSPSTSLNSLLKETNTSDNSLPRFETFCFDAEEISSGSTTTHYDNSLPEYEVFHDDHVKEISSGSPTTYSDSSLYASFLFDLSINPFPPTDRSDFYEFIDGLIPFISLPKYDCFLFKVEPNSRDFTKDVVDDISLTKKPQVHFSLPTHPNLQLNIKFQPSSKYLFTYVVWIFLPFLVYSVAPHYLLSLRNEDTIFDPGICISHFSRPDISHRTYPSKRLNSFCYDDDDDEDYTIAIIPILSTEEPDNSLSMGDEHIDTIPATESDEVLKSSVENLILIPSESEGIPEHMCDVPFHDNYPPLDVSKDQFEDFSESNDEFYLTGDDSFSIDNIDYVEASPPDSELVGSEVMEIVIPEDEEIEDDNLREKLIKFPPTDRSDFYEFTDELIPFISPPEYDCFLFKIDNTLSLVENADSEATEVALTLKIETDTEKVYDDPFDSKGEKIKESKLLIDELDLPCDFLPPSEDDSFISQDFSRVDAKPSTNNEDKVNNPGILIQEKPFEIITHIIQDKKLVISNASLVLEDFDLPFYEPLFFKEVPSIPGNVKTHAEGFCPPVFISSASLGNHVTDTIKKGQDPSKTGQNRAENRKRGKVNSQKSTKSQTRQNQSQRNQKVKENKEERLKLPISKVVYKEGAEFDKY